MKFKTLITFLSIACLFAIFVSSCNQHNKIEGNKAVDSNDSLWHTPDSSTLASDPKADLIRYGQKLISNTSYFIGPKGIIAQVTNGMNCQNCHLQAGTKSFGNNYSAVASTYPKFRPRSGTIEDIYKRVNDCIQRSLNGKAIDTNSREMQAITTYIMWLGKDVPKKKIPYGSGIKELAFMYHAADTDKGKYVYIQKCQVCHGSNGKGAISIDGTGFIYPPLWGEHSFNNGAGIMRLFKMAGYVKYNMPFGTSYPNSQLSDEEAWDVAAYITSKPRPVFDLSADWPDISKKPIDHPFGPYTDSFPEVQHKYGPFKPIADARKKLDKK